MVIMVIKALNLNNKMRIGRPHMRSKERKRILAFVAALAVCTGTVFEGLTSGAGHVYADCDKRSGQPIANYIFIAYSNTFLFTSTNFGFTPFSIAEIISASSSPSLPLATATPRSAML